MWVAHWGQMYERSKAYAHLFQPRDAMDTKGDIHERGGLKFAFTQALERTNLKYFHQYFMTMSRRPKEVISDSGYQMLREMLNPFKTNKSKFFCRWCGRGFCYRKRYVDHEDKRCRQRAPPDDSKSGYYVAEREIARVEAAWKAHREAEHKRI